MEEWPRVTLLVEANQQLNEMTVKEGARTLQGLFKERDAKMKDKKPTS
jgi:hypothetical protein